MIGSYNKEYNVWYKHPKYPRVEVLITEGRTSNKIRVNDTWVCRWKPELGTKLYYRELSASKTKRHEKVSFATKLGGEVVTEQPDRLVLEVLLGRELIGEVDHIDNDSSNHSPLNLQEISRQDNINKAKSQFDKNFWDNLSKKGNENKREKSPYRNIRIERSDGRVYSDIFEVIDDMKIYKGVNVLQVCKGKKKSAYGYSWKFM